MLERAPFRLLLASVVRTSKSELPEVLIILAGVCRIEFRDHSTVAMWVAGETDVLQMLSAQLPSAVQRCLRRDAAKASRGPGDTDSMIGTIGRFTGQGLTATQRNTVEIFAGSSKNPLFGMNIAEDDQYDGPS